MPTAVPSVGELRASDWLTFQLSCGPQHLPGHGRWVLVADSVAGTCHPPQAPPREQHPPCLVPVLKLLVSMAFSTQFLPSSLADVSTNFCLGSVQVEKRFIFQVLALTNLRQPLYYPPNYIRTEVSQPGRDLGTRHRKEGRDLGTAGH